MNNICKLIESYAEHIDPSKDMTCSEAKNIIQNSRTAMEVAGNSYIYGYMKGKVMVPVLNIPIMSDEEWNKLAHRNYLERKAVTV